MSAPEMAVDPARCPLCGGPNGCAVAAGTTTCWCFSVTISPDTLERVPEAARGVACVCAACAAGRPPASPPEDVPTS